MVLPIFFFQAYFTLLAREDGTGTGEAPSEKVISSRRLPELRAVEALGWITKCARAKPPTEVCAWTAKSEYVAKSDLTSQSSSKLRIVWLLGVVVKCLRCHLVPLVVESYPGDSGVAWTPEADDLLGVTPLEHPDASILCPGQVWNTEKQSVPSARLSVHLNENASPNTRF